MVDVVAVDGELLEAFRALGLEPVVVSTIGAVPGWRSGRSTYRVEVAGGATFKARRVPGREDKVAGAAALAAAVRLPGIPEPVGCWGPITVERWVEGRSLAATRLTTAKVEAAADLLARLHGVVEVPGARLPQRRATAPVAEEAATNLSALAEGRVLSPADVEALRRLLERLPTSAEQGVIHGDLCAGNLVLTPDGALVSVDNEGLRIGFFGYDLARTWCRWPMSVGLWRRFCQRYAQAFPTDASSEAAGAWRAVAAVRSASLWRATPGPGLDDAKDALRRLVAMS